MNIGGGVHCAVEVCGWHDSLNHFFTEREPVCGLRKSYNTSILIIYVIQLLSNGNLKAQKAGDLARSLNAIRRRILHGSFTKHQPKKAIQHGFLFL